MALDVKNLKARETTMPARKGTRTKRDLGPNPFLDGNWEFSLKASYDNAQAFELDFQGEYVDTKLKRGKNKGQPTRKLQGDAADAETLIRDAADKLGIGASVAVVPALVASGPNKGKPRPGWYTVKYQGQKRKQSRKGTSEGTRGASEGTSEGTSETPAE